MKVFLLSSHIFIRTRPFCFAVTWCLSATSIYSSVSSNDPGMKSETYGVIWHVAPESKIQLVNCELPPNFSLEHSSLPDICAIDAYILWSLLFLPLSHAQLPFSLKRTCFCRFSLSLGGFRHFVITWSSDPHLKHFQGVRSVHLLSEWPAAQDFSFSYLIFLKHFSAEWLIPQQKVHFFWTVFAFSLFIPKTWAAFQI